MEASDSFSSDACIKNTPRLEFPSPELTVRNERVALCFGLGQKINSDAFVLLLADTQKMPHKHFTQILSREQFSSFM